MDDSLLLGPDDTAPPSFGGTTSTPSLQANTGKADTNSIWGSLLGNIITATGTAYTATQQKKAATATAASSATTKLLIYGGLGLLVVVLVISMLRRR